jgi:hypothetical protein
VVKSTVARLIVQFFKEAGALHLRRSGYRSSTSPTRWRSRDQFVPAMHEGPAAHTAAAYAKAKRGLAVCLASSGAGATNLLTGRLRL